MAVAVLAALNVVALSNVSVRPPGRGTDGDVADFTSAASGRTSGSAFANSSGSLSL